MTHRVLVSGATGNQGGAVLRALLGSDISVSALVRAADDRRARKMAATGVDVRPADYDDPASLRAALRGVDVAFLMTTMAQGVAGEVRQGRAFIDAAAEVGIGHLVYSSVAAADRSTGIPHFDSKATVERHLVDSGVPWTVTAPAFFFENVLFPWNVADLRAGRFRQALPPEVTLQQVSLGDIGRFNAHVLARPRDFAERRIDYAGDELTPAEMSAALGAALGRPIRFEQQSMDEVRAHFEDMATMYEWFEKVGFGIDLQRLRDENPGVGWTPFLDWAIAQDWSAVLHPS